MSDMTTAELFVLTWLSKEDVSLYGECKGRSLDRLVERGFVQIGPAPLGRSDDCQVVSVTEAGHAFLKQERGDE